MSDKHGTIEDGFGSEWVRCDTRCGLEVVRPGRVQCWCDGCEMPAADILTLAKAMGQRPDKVAFVVATAERRIREEP